MPNMTRMGELHAIDDNTCLNTRFWYKTYKQDMYLNLLYIALFWCKNYQNPLRIDEDI